MRLFSVYVASARSDVLAHSSVPDARQNTR